VNNFLLKIDLCGELEPYRGRVTGDGLVDRRYCDTSLGVSVIVSQLRCSHVTDLCTDSGGVFL